MEVDNRGHPHASDSTCSRSSDCGVRAEQPRTGALSRGTVRRGGGRGPAAEAVVQDDPEKYKVLYTDTEIERLVGEGLDELKENGRIDLDVVPNGTTRSLREVFEALGLEEGRLRYERSASGMMITVAWWRASPSYELTMKTHGGPENGGLGDRNPNQRVYGIRIEKYQE